MSLPAARIKNAAATRESPSRPSWLTPGFAYFVLVANAFVILGFWWLSSGFEIARSSSDFFNGVGRVTGLLGTYLALWQLLLMARLPWLERCFGLERMTVLHRWNGYLVLGLLLGHGVFQTLGYQLGDGKDVAGQLADFITSYQGLLGAIVALGLFVAIVVMSVTIARRHLAYETWYFIHLYAYLAIALAFSHQIATGVDFAGNPLFIAYWYALYAATIGSLIVFRVLEPLALYSRHRFRVQSVEKEARGVFSVYITGRDLDRFGLEAGQFAIWRFLDAKRWWQAHPFSLSAVPDGRRLRITIKNIGDFTAGVHALRPGTPVLIDGPFGKFTEAPASPKVLLIAGGIGITPIRPLAEGMAADGFDVRVLYRAHGEGDLVFKKELDALAAGHGVHVDYLLTQSGGRQLNRESWFAPSTIRRLVPDIADRAVYVCGPSGMMRLLQSSLEAVGVPPERIRTEVFRFQ
ncbi:MAG TPA: ferredoxin reductase family protein [Candidatus Dormibacteraeota bacterium]